MKAVVEIFGVEDGKCELTGKKGSVCLAAFKNGTFKGRISPAVLVNMVKKQQEGGENVDGGNPGGDIGAKRSENVSAPK